MANNRKIKDIPFEIQDFAMRITSNPDEHINYNAYITWVQKERRKYMNEIMDLFENIKEREQNNQQLPTEQLKQADVSNNEVAVCLKPDHVICCLKKDGLCTEDLSDCEFRQTDC